MTRFCLLFTSRVVVGPLVPVFISEREICNGPLTLSPYFSEIQTCGGGRSTSTTVWSWRRQRSPIPQPWRCCLYPVRGIYCHSFRLSQCWLMGKCYYMDYFLNGVWMFSSSVLSISLLIVYVHWQLTCLTFHPLSLSPVHQLQHVHLLADQLQL